MDSTFIQRITEQDSQLAKDMKKYGRRNIVLMTIAPCGSISCLTQTTSGLEPVFATSYMRGKKGNPGDSDFRSDFVDQSGDHWMHFNVYHKGVKDWMDKNKVKEGIRADELLPLLEKTQAYGLSKFKQLVSLSYRFRYHRKIRTKV
jgi:ribonucleoside-diphosphate reductase alpha chain